MRSLRRNRRRKLGGKPPLSIEQILAWADEWFEQIGKWPTLDSGPIPGSLGENWCEVNAALALGLRGLPGRSSLTKLWAEKRGVRNMAALPALTEEQILAWADAHFNRTGCWPRATSGRITEAPGETWKAVTAALRMGCRGLPGGYSLARLLHDTRGVRNRMALAKLTEERILGWADSQHRATGEWPSRGSGAIQDAPGEGWIAVDEALRKGKRGLPGGSSLARLWAEKRGVRNTAALPAFTEEQILAWADAHFRRTGCWPQTASGRISEAPGETWLAVNGALSIGRRGLPGGVSLARLLHDKRGVRTLALPPPLTVEDILNWSDAHRRATGEWPHPDSGPIPEAPGETWLKVNRALRHGRRGLPGGASLAKLLQRQRDVQGK